MGDKTAAMKSFANALAQDPTNQKARTNLELIRKWKNDSPQPQDSQNGEGSSGNNSENQNPNSGSNSSEKNSQNQKKPQSDKSSESKSEKNLNSEKKSKSELEKNKLFDYGIQDRIKRKGPGNNPFQEEDEFW